MKQPLRLVYSDEPTRQMIALAEIEQEHRESKWTAFSEPRQNPLLDVDGILRKAGKYVVIDRPVSRYRRLWRWFVETLRAIPR